MIRLYPTPARRALLDDIAANLVYRDAIGDSWISCGRKVNAVTRELEQAGWVTLADPDPGEVCRPWRLTALGRAYRAIRICDYGTHVVAETGGEDDPTVLGEARRDGGRWTVAGGEDPLVIRARAGRTYVVAELWHRVAQALADEQSGVTR